jgi:hypothetical protein
MRYTPTSNNKLPVTIFGKILFNFLGGTMDIAIWIQTVQSMLPRIAPQASGHGSWVPSAAVGQVPFLYRMAV